MSGPDLSAVPTCEAVLGMDQNAGIALFGSLTRNIDSPELANQFLNETFNICSSPRFFTLPIIYAMENGAGMTMRQLNVRFPVTSGGETVAGLQFPGKFGVWRFVGTSELADFGKLLPGSEENCPLFATQIDPVTPITGIVRGVYVDFPEAISNHGCPIDDLSIYMDPAGKLPGFFSTEKSTKYGDVSCVLRTGVACGLTTKSRAWTALTGDASNAKIAADLLSAVAAN